MENDNLKCKIQNSPVIARAKARSNPVVLTLFPGLLRYARNDRGFTIIESLVAITILVIAVTGPLALASKGLAYSNYVKDEITAFYLANEAMDVIRNIRDTNLKGTGTWLDVDITTSPASTLDSVCSKGTGDNGCRISVWENPIDLKKTLHSSDFVLKKRVYVADSRVAYSHEFENSCSSDASDCADEDSPYSRKITVEKLGVGDDEIRVTVVVSWMSGSIDRNVTITENLFKLQ